MAKNEVVIFDLDNCLADDNHRAHLIDRTKTGDARYEAYHANMHLDRPNQAAVSKLNAHVEDGRRIFILTARPVRYRQATMAWLGVLHAIHYDELIMRSDGDHGTSAKVKRKMIEWMIDCYGVKLGDIVMAYDDREDVIGMYRGLNIPAERLAVNASQECCEKGHEQTAWTRQHSWLDDDFRREWIFYESDTGKVLGRVTGTNTKNAFSGNKPLGEYINLESAKRAVEQAL